MSGKASVPDAWDDDWVNVADKPEAKTTTQEPAPKLTKAERRAQHVEQQKQLWDSAENPGRNLWLEAQGVAPMKQEFKPTLLSRKPPTIAKKGAEDDEDSEEERRKAQEASFEERQRKAKIEREEKQKRYAEARERIMGSSNASPAANSRESSQGRDNNRRGRGNRMNGSRRSQPDTPAERSPVRAAQPRTGDNQLFDPDDMSRRLAPKRETTQSPREDQPLRQPRGPDNSGRGGFGFANRGGKAYT
ncbi:hypothetical protein PRZ48_001466 [Zasmidium cellare]|uniref:SUZ domain-containing protein n=1 Tax=Zasmidium cellare TaxID=395010 RepID=A0ABR0F2Y5_ZASCE|nr:hypothetical protein PRZ48_001466 [Zasmidium cellare]